MANKKIMELKKQIDEIENSYSNKITELNKNLLKLEKENEQVIDLLLNFFSIFS